MLIPHPGMYRKLPNLRLLTAACITRRKLGNLRYNAPFVRHVAQVCDLRYNRGL